MFDSKKLLGAISELGGQIKKSTAQYVPAMLSEDKRFANAYAASLALLVCADLAVEENETIAALTFIQNDDCLKERNLVSSTLEFYGQFVAELSETFDNQPTYLLKKAKIIQEHVAVSLGSQYKNDLQTLCNTVVGIHANEKERQVCQEIMMALK